MATLLPSSRRSFTSGVRRRGFCLAATLIPVIAGATATVVVNTHETDQTIDGFGACIVSYDLLPEYQDPAFYDRAVFDLGVSILRLPMLGVEEHGNDNGDPADFAWEALDRKGLAYTMELARQFRARGVNHILSTPWSPPAWMKTNRSAIQGGRLRPDRRDEFAEYLGAYVRGAEKFFDIPIDHVSLQNELLFVEPYESCVYNPLQLRETLRAVQRGFKAQGLGTALVLPEEMGMADRLALYLEPLMADEETRRFPGFFASHGGNGMANWRTIAAQLAPYGRRFWMTETSGHNLDWRGGLALAENMHDTLVGGRASAYIYWQFSEPKPDRMTLLAAGDFTPKAQAARHFIRFVRPGMKRVHVGGDPGAVLISAYKHPVTRDIAVVLINPRSRPTQIDLRLVDPNPPTNWLVFTSQENRYLEPGSLTATDALEIPARGMVTLFGRGGETLKELPSLVPEGWSRPALGAALSPDAATVPDQRLHAAARANDIPLVRQLLAEKLDPNALNVGGLSPLHRAAWPGHVDAVKALIAGGANPNVRDDGGGSPLLIAASNGHDAYIEAIVQAGADINLANATGQRALHRAALAGHVGTARALLRLGADPNLADNHGWTALHWAAACPVRASLDLLQVLVAAGAKADVPDREGLTPLHVAAANLVDPGLHARQRQPVALHYINARRLKVLVDAGAGVDVRDSAGRTALHWAAWLGETMHGEDVGNRPFFEYRTEAVRYLLAAGADPTLRDSAGKTAAEYATAEGYTETASFLNSAAALPWLAGRALSDVRGELPAEVTAARGQMPSPANRRLMRAVATGDLAGVQAALAAGANPNQFGMGGSPLHRAVIEGHLEVVRALVAAGAEVALRDSDGYTPYERAMQNNETEIAEVLQSAPAKPVAQ